MNRYQKFLILVILLTMLASGCAKQAKPFTQIVAFGDDWTDNGNALRITKKDIENKVTVASIIPPSDLYWEGRFSNGPVAVEVMAQRLKVNLTDYAVSAALSGGSNLVTGGEFEATGLLSQVKQFESELNGKKADSGALYFLGVSTGNDLWSWAEDNTGNSAVLADEVLKNLQTAIMKLSQLGAKQFFVVNAPDLTIMPGMLAVEKEGFAKDLANFQAYYQSQLPKIMADLSTQLQIEINIFDFQAIEDKIRSDPQKYSLKNLTDSCMADYWAITACENPNEYYFWDPFHNTRKVNQIFGEAMAAVYEK